jgi:hypothetical protein
MENNEIIGWIPWPVAAATAAWFVLMAYKAGKNRVLWAFGGGMLGLLVTTLVLGLGQATFLPFHSAEVASFRIKVAVLAILLVSGIGWLFTGSLHRHLLASRKQTPAPVPEPAVKPPSVATKPQL